MHKQDTNQRLWLQASTQTRKHSSIKIKNIACKHPLNQNHKSVGQWKNSLYIIMISNHKVNWTKC